ncbi:hypothetical protein [Capnocytophaga periodontitidis]|uniref:hypothetical protein n=1 Tax=Capnocytophaga periodontitidis TaxID=2795027 RepID=UPI0018E1A18E|nr:hypothetical protein [Capnocytophaga periodontitidis]MBI1667421.1 hypothetical protein [Capnocytophaga periodontitidis]
MNTGALLNGISNGLTLAQQGKDLYDSFGNKNNDNGNSGNTVVNENHYHVTKSKEELEIERQRLELERQQASFANATARSQHAEKLRNERKIVDSITDKGSDNTALYMLGGILFLGFIIVLMRKK